MNILIAEDEMDIRNLLILHFEQEGYSVFAAQDGLEALTFIKSEAIDLAVIDVMMPRLDGFNLLRRIREIGTLPVIFLTARGDDMDKILGLGLGADDYLIKPFSMPELLARVSAQLRRSHQYAAPVNENSSVITCDNLVLDKSGCCLRKDGRPLELNAKEFKIVQYLMENPGRVFTRKQIYRAVWDEDVYYDDNTVMVHMSHIRNKVENDPKNPTYFITIRGIGYKFEPKNGGRV